MPQHQRYWTDPHLSVGSKSEERIGGKFCYEVIGEAYEVFKSSAPAITTILDDNKDELEKNSAKLASIAFYLFMVGSSPERSEPILVFACLNKYQRTRAKKLVEEAGICAKYPSIQLKTLQKMPAKPNAPLAPGYGSGDDGHSTRGPYTSFEAPSDKTRNDIKDYETGKSSGEPTTVPAESDMIEHQSLSNPIVGPSGILTDHNSFPFPRPPTTSHQRERQSSVSALERPLENSQVHEAKNLRSLCGSLYETKATRATLGGVIRISDSFYGTTAFHVGLDLPKEVEPLPRDLQFDESDDEDDIDTTSQGMCDIRLSERNYQADLSSKQAADHLLI
jgi:hypothetical protein